MSAVCGAPGPATRSCQQIMNSVHNNYRPSDIKTTNLTTVCICLPSRKEEIFVIILLCYQQLFSFCIHKKLCEEMNQVCNYLLLQIRKNLMLMLLQCGDIMLSWILQTLITSSCVSRDQEQIHWMCQSTTTTIMHQQINIILQQLHALAFMKAKSSA